MDASPTTAFAHPNGAILSPRRTGPCTTSFPRRHPRVPSNPGAAALRAVASAPAPNDGAQTVAADPGAFRVLHLADTWVAVSKPAGMHVHRTKLYRTGRGERFLLDLVREAMAEQRGRLSTVLPIHRLDRPTTGVVVFGLDESRNAAMVQEALQATTSRKQYLAMAFGTGMDATWRNEHALKDLDGKTRKQRPACTTFERLAEFEEEGMTAVRATLATGRRHQIRRHLSYSRYPVVGDTSHGDTKLNHAANDAYGVPRLCLHARRVEFTDPFTKERHHLSVPLPDDIRDFMRRLPSYSPEMESALDWDDVDDAPGASEQPVEP